MKSKVISRIAAVFAAALSVVVALLLVVPVFASAQERHVSGERTDGARPTIVLEHGGFADGSSWDQVISILQREGYTVARCRTHCRASPRTRPISPVI